MDADFPVASLTINRFTCHTHMLRIGIQTLDQVTVTRLQCRRQLATATPQMHHHSTRNPRLCIDAIRLLSGREHFRSRHA